MAAATTPRAPTETVSPRETYKIFDEVSLVVRRGRKPFLTRAVVADRLAGRECMIASSSGGGEAPTSDMARLRLWHASSPWVIGVQNPRCALSNCRRRVGLRHHWSGLKWQQGYSFPSRTCNSN